MTSDSECCPICRDAGRPDEKAHRYLALEQAAKSYTVMACAKCRIRWLEPFEAGTEDEPVYDDDYYGPVYLKEKEELAAQYQEIARRFRAFGVKERLLDVGCGTGDFLAVAEAAGISSEGIEPSAYAARRALERGLRVRHGVLESLVQEKMVYEGAHCAHVLEHVPDISTFLEQLGSVLAPAAPVYFEVPLQFDGVLDIINRARGVRLRYSSRSIHHHYFFTPNSLSRLLARHRFEVLSLATFAPLRRAARRAGPRKWALQALLWTADRLAKRGDVISVWARRAT